MKTSPIYLTLIFCSFVNSLNAKQYQPRAGEFLGAPLIIDEDEGPALSAKFIIKRQTAKDIVPSPSPSPSPETPDEEKSPLSPSPSPTPSASPTPSRSPSPSASPTPSQAPSPSPTHSESPPTSPSTSPTTTEATTTQPTTTTTEQPNISEGGTTKGYFCMCDLQVRQCDMNCCCDPDCSFLDKELFTTCTGSSIYDPRFHQDKEHSCIKSYLMYRDNTPFRTDRSDKSLFCVVKENVKQSTEFSQKDMSRIRKLISHGKINSKPKYGWNHLYSWEGFKLAETPYKYGSAIWTVKPNEGDRDGYKEEMLRLPAPFHTRMCSINEPVKFLKNSYSSCILPVFPLFELCETTPVLNVNHFKNFSIITNPAMIMNGTEYPMTSIIPAKLCRNNDWENCEDFTSDEEIHLPLPTRTFTECQNVLRHFNLTFVHEGILGITQVFATIMLVDVPFTKKEVRQHFTIDFIWESELRMVGMKNETNQTVEDVLAGQKLPRSGNPGYIIGKPIILGQKVIGTTIPPNDTSPGAKKIEKIHVLPDSSKWLRIPGAGDCPLDTDEIKHFQRHPIEFGYEHVSSCKLPLERFRTCQQLQKHIAAIILGAGDEDPQHYVDNPMYIAAYGSPDAFSSDWVPTSFTDKSWLLPSTFPSAQNPISRGCERLTTSVHITIAHAYVGPVDSPQAKITGVFFDPEEPIQIPAADNEAKKKVHQITLTTTVSFVDVSGKPTTRVATWPVLSIQLPSDFFYPFSSSPSPMSSAGQTKLNYYYPIMLTAFVLVL